MHDELWHLQTKRELFFDSCLKTAKLLITFQVRRAESQRRKKNFKFMTSGYNVTSYDNEEEVKLCVLWVSVLQSNPAEPSDLHV